MIEFLPATIEHAEAIRANLRGAQMRTMEKLGIDFDTLITKALTQPSYTALVDGVPAVMWGVYQETLLGDAKLWLLGTPLIEAHPVTFLRVSRDFVKRARMFFGPLNGMVDADFIESVRWLEWLGFVRTGNGPYIPMRYN